MVQVLLYDIQLILGLLSFFYYSGIGVHHAGCNKNYLMMVETLFRSGHLRVVIATGMFVPGNFPPQPNSICVIVIT